MRLWKIIAILLFLSLHGCVGIVPVPSGQSGYRVYEPPTPPPIVFAGAPDVIVLPDTDDVYVVPDIAVDLFFWNGWWWRPWEGRWYRSLFHTGGWIYYKDIPGFYFDVDTGWRTSYLGRHWYGHRWDYERISHQRLQQNWKNWGKDHHWERQVNWGIHNYRPRPQQQRQDLRLQRQHKYQQRPEISKPERHHEDPPPQQRQPHIRPSRQQPEAQQPPVQPDARPQPIQSQVQSPRPQPQVKPPQGHPQVQSPKPQPQEKIQPKQPSQTKEKSETEEEEKKDAK